MGKQEAIPRGESSPLSPLTSPPPSAAFTKSVSLASSRHHALCNVQCTGEGKTVLYHTSQHSEVACSTILCVVPYSKVQCCIIQYRIVLYHSVQDPVAPYNTVQCLTVQYNTVQYNTVQYNTVQYSTVQYSTVQ